MRKNWPTRTLDEVCQFRGGGTPSKSVERYWQGDIPWVSPKDMKFDIVSDSIDHISQEAIDRSATSLIPKDSVLMVVRSGILARTVPIAITGRALTINQDLKALCPNGALDARFLYHLLGSKMDVLLSMVSRGATVHRLMTDHIRSLAFILPPPPEQQRIVGVLDEALDSIATAKRNAESNRRNAHDIFASHLESVFNERGKGWQNKTLADSCDVFADGDWVESKDQSPHGIRLIQTGNVGNGVFKDRVNKSRYISEATFKRLRCTEIFAGDCLISRLPDPVGRSCLLPESGERMITAVDCTIVRFSAKLVMPEFFIYYSQSQEYLRSVDSETRGTTRNRISRNSLGQLAIPVAPLGDQKRIIAKLDSLSAESQRLAALYERKLAALETLKTSLLHEAFSGNL